MLTNLAEIMCGSFGGHKLALQMVAVKRVHLVLTRMYNYAWRILI